MSVLVDKNSRVIVQGLTGKEGTFHAGQMIEYGTNIIAGVTPGKGGQIHLDRPVFNTVKETVDELQADTSIIFVPPAYAAKAIIEAAEIDGWAVKYPASLTAFGVRALFCVESIVSVNVVIPDADVLAVFALKVVLSN